MTRTQPQPEFSRRVDISGLGAGVRSAEIEADADERAALAARFELRALERLSATVQLARAGARGAVRLRARLTADVVQTCVVTVIPVPARIEETIELLFVPAEKSAACREVVIDAVGEDPPEPLMDNVIDVGEVVAEYLALALDPYPRAGDATLDDGVWSDDAGEGPADGPFAQLRERKSSG